MYCKTCGNIYEDPNAAFCTRCGTPRGSGSSYCEYCGSPMAPGQGNCSNCGRPVNGYSGGYGQNYYQSYNPNAGANTAYDQGGNRQVPIVPIKYRNIALCIIFTIITFGIYDFYWFVQLTEDANALSGDHKTSGGLSLLLNIITCGLYGIYWAYRQGEKLEYAKQIRGIGSNDFAIIYLLLQAVKLGFIGQLLMQNEINKFATTR